MTSYIWVVVVARKYHRYTFFHNISSIPVFAETHYRLVEKMSTPVKTARPDFQPLSEEEIQSFFSDLDKDSDGYITIQELEAKLEEVHAELAPEPQKHNLTHPHRRELEKGESRAGDGLHDFLHSLIPGYSNKIAKDEFCQHVKGWNIPSQQQTSSEEESKEDIAEERRLPTRRRIRAYWAVHGWSMLFMTCVVALMIAFGVWQMTKVCLESLDFLHHSC